MKLDLFNNKRKDDDKNFIQEFIEELTEAVQKNSVKNEIKENSIFNQFQIDKKVTAECRDKMRVERIKILNNYAKDTENKGDMYYIYEKNSTKENTYNLYLCKPGETNKVIEVKKENLPENATFDSILRMKNGKYILDKDATSNILKKMNTKFDELIDEQNTKISELRIENNIYEIVDIIGNRVWLEDKTENLGNCFEEVIFSNDDINNLSVGDKFEYLNGEYKAI